MDITKDDLQNLNAIFALARKSIAENEQELINVINFRQKIFEKLNKLFEPEKIKDKPHK